MISTEKGIEKTVASHISAEKESEKSTVALEIPAEKEIGIH